MVYFGPMLQFTPHHEEKIIDVHKKTIHGDILICYLENHNKEWFANFGIGKYIHISDFESILKHLKKLDNNEKDI